MSVRSDVGVCRACGRVDLRASLRPVAGAPHAFECAACAGGAPG